MLGVSFDTAERLLADHVEQGQALIERASFVGDMRDYESWKGARSQWIARTAQALAQIYPESDEVERFQRAAASPSGGRWQMEYTRDLERARVAVDVVVALRDALQRSREPVGPGVAREQPVDSATWQEQSHGLGAIEDPSHPAELLPVAQEEWQLAGEDSQLAKNDSRSEQPALAARSELAPLSDAAATRAEEPIGGNELVAKSNGSVPTTTSAGPKLDRSREVFLVHGRNEQVRHAVAHLLGRAGQHEVTILNERPNDRKMLVEQFEPRSPGSRYAIVLLTADDVGAPRLDSEREPYYSPRARQGVVFELGFLVAALTPRCVCVLYEDGVELPCDLDGITYIRLDLTGAWQSKLLLQLRSAGFDYDLNSLAPV
jgi:predicted nucleotide-binding protein